ncbi:YoaK family protein [Streptosporangium sp. NPDC051022]|uniref:YoaK family protein n=1 Tax=Streptosporangium sp. NPDC051022 TaxID=3155752 RepID=UPI00342CCDEB
MSADTAAHVPGRARVASPADLRTRDTLLVLLTVVAGVVDVLGFVGLDRVFTANMTGNVVLFGLAAGDGATGEMVRCGLAVLAFAAGLAAGFRIARESARKELWPRGVTWALAADLLLQLVFLAWWAGTAAHPGRLAEVGLIVLSSIAMGVQTAAARQLDAYGITTTFVTGTLTALCGGLVAGDRRGAVQRFLVIVGLAVGAAVGAVLMWLSPLAAAVAGPAVVLAVVLVAALRLHGTSQP